MTLVGDYRPIIGNIPAGEVVCMLPVHVQRYLQERDVFITVRIIMRFRRGSSTSGRVTNLYIMLGGGVERWHSSR